MRRALKLPALNASLRLQHYVEHNQVFPSHQDLLPHLQAEVAEHQQALKALAEEGEVALGWRSQAVYRARFNLAYEDRALITGEPAAAPAPAVVGERLLLAPGGTA